MTITHTELIQLDPAELEDNPDNPRRKIDPADIIDSIRAAGVLQPILVRRAGGTYVVVAGHRRRDAAIRVGLTTVPCVVLADGLSDLANALVENENRGELSTTEIADAFSQLSLAGMSDDDIAGLVGYIATPEDVARTRAVAKMTSKTRKVIEEHNLTLDEAAVMVEFEDDKEASLTIKQALEYGRDLTHTIERLRRDAEAEKAMAAKEATLAAKGIKTTRSWPSGATVVSQLADDRGKKLTAAGHAKCPGALVRISYQHWSKAKDPVDVDHYCTQPKLHRKISGGKVEAVKKPAEIQKEKDEAKQASANVRDWKAACEVRLAWVAEFCQRRTAPKTTLRWATLMLLSDEYDLGYGSSLGMLMTIDEDQDDPQGHLVSHATDARLPLLLFAHVASAIEGKLSRKDAWQVGRWGHDTQAAYLKYLIENGYGPAPLEKAIADWKPER